MEEESSFSDLVDEGTWCFRGLLLSALTRQVRGLGDLMPVLGKILAMTCTRPCYPMPCEPMRKRWSLQKPTYPLEKLKIPHETWPRDRQWCKDKQTQLCWSMRQFRTHLLGTHPIGLLPRHSSSGGLIQPTSGHPEKELLWRSPGPKHASSDRMINLNIHSPEVWVWPTMSKEAESCQERTTENQGLMERKTSPKEFFCCSETDVS